MGSRVTPQLGAMPTCPFLPPAHSPASVAGRGTVQSPAAIAQALAIVNYVCPFTPVVMLLPCAYLAFTRPAA